ncbi:MAG: Fur family transcriptional regulator [Acidimicrobiales bacterium]|nr:Fur family transcriptional regulator [Acidimicrobiales bacterium]MDG1876280.1 Fur family transcriptional regulator [Acidimicrobiales bacterium]
MATDELDDEINTLLRQDDQRYTKGRRALVATLRAVGQPVTIPQILAASDGLAQSSVYRNLVVLEDAGVVTRIITNDDFARYELAERLTHHHHHLICSSCGDVTDFSLDDLAEASLDDALHEIAAQVGFTVEAHRLDLVGTCASCD